MNVQHRHDTLIPGGYHPTQNRILRRNKMKMLCAKWDLPRLVVSFLLIMILANVSLGSLNPAPVQAQDNLQFQRITLAAPEDVELTALYSGVAEVPTQLANAEGLVPAVLLAHHGAGNKEKWYNHLPVFVEAGYVVLAVDLRGHGELARYRGSRGGNPENWLNDTRLWIEWLRQQAGIDPNRINIIGASLGGDVALNIVAEDPAIVSIAVLSPGLEVQGITTAPAVAEIEQPVYFVTGNEDVASMEAVQAFILDAPTETHISIYNTSACCTFLLDTEPELLSALLAWLKSHNTPAN
jgi:dienelactone hydrolase